MLHIAITGTDGSGKTTLCRQLALSLQGLKTVVSSPWDSFTTIQTSFDLDPAKKDSLIQDFLKKIGGGSRLYFFNHVILHSLELALKKEPELLVCDGYWYKYAISEIGLGLDPEKVIKAVELFPVPAQVFFLKISPEAALSRKSILSEYDGGVKEKFLKLQNNMLKLWELFTARFGFTVLDGNLPINDNIKKIRSILGI